MSVPQHVRVPEVRISHSAAADAAAARPTVTLVIAGPALTSHDLRVVRQRVLDLWTELRGGRLVVDLSAVDEIDVRGLLTLISCRRLATVAGIDLVLRSPSATVVTLLRQLRLASGFQVAGGTCT